jgi:pimeloyl-ACP methyl ester carboxylesterase
VSAAVAERIVGVRDGLFQTRLLEAGAGQPVVYLHGAEGPIGPSAGAAPGWPPFLGVLAERFRMIAPEQPGFGESTGAEHLMDVLDLIVYQLDLLDALGLERPHLVGHDLGGMIAAELAAVAGGRVGRLALVAPLGLWLDETPVLDVFATPRDDLVSMGWHDPSAPAAQAVLAPPADEEEQQLARLRRAQNLATAGRYLWPIPDRGLKKRLHRVTPPTLLLWGADDRVVPPAYAEAFRAALPNASLELLPNCGHYPMLEQPGAFTRTLVPFLTG